MSPREAVLQWYVWAGRELHYSYETVDNMPLSDFFDMVILYDKINHPDDYVPAERLFGH